MLSLRIIAGPFYAGIIGPFGRVFGSCYYYWIGGFESPLYFIGISLSIIDSTTSSSFLLILANALSVSIGASI